MTERKRANVRVLCSTVISTRWWNMLPRMKRSEVQHGAEQGIRHSTVASRSRLQPGQLPSLQATSANGNGHLPLRCQTVASTLHKLLLFSCRLQLQPGRPPSLGFFCSFHCLPGYLTHPPPLRLSCPKAKQSFKASLLGF
jgi:hypothetical protein